MARSGDAKYHSSLKGKYRTLRYVAKQRKMPLEISYGEFCLLTALPCHYCGAGTESEKCPTSYRLDRKDNAKGYTSDNVVPCCAQCNFIRGDVLSVDEMYVVIAALVGYRRTRKTA